MKRILFIGFSILLLAITLPVVYVLVSGKIDDPDYQLQELEKLQKNGELPFAYCEGAWLKQNEEGVYELYVEGDAVSMGYKRGMLSEQLIHLQEKLFLEKINEMIPSRSYLMVLKDLIAWFNRDLPDHLIEEHKKELFAISRFASDEFDFVGSKYQRILNYHAAHDIGHALENYELVGCTSFGIERNDSVPMFIGRNFDFSMGEAFAENKIVCFYNPDRGHPFAMISWSDFIGCVSGMNVQGLTVTLNAGENDIPEGTGTPVSLIAREILQHADDIETAYQIASNRKAFVSESILIGSAKDGKSAIIEKTPDTTFLFFPESSRLLCSNHFQSESLLKEVPGDFNSSSHYRYTRLEQLLDHHAIQNASDMAQILRDQKGVDGKNIGFGNEKAINQLVAHHSIIFNPDSLRFWVSTSPFQLGKYLCYDLNEVFGKHRELTSNQKVHLPEFTIDQDSFLTSAAFKQFRSWQLKNNEIESAVEQQEKLDMDVSNYLALNPEHYYSYELLGLYFDALYQRDSSRKYYNLALTKEIPYISDVQRIESALKANSN